MCSAIASDDVAAGDGALREDQARPAAEPEVVDQLAVVPEGLGPHSGRAGDQVAGERGHIWGRRKEKPPVDRAEHLLVPVRQCGGRGRGTPASEDRGQVARGEVGSPIALQGQSQHRVWLDVDRAVDPPGQVNAEKRVARVRHRVDQTLHQVVARRRDAVVLAADGMIAGSGSSPAIIASPADCRPPQTTTSSTGKSPESVDTTNLSCPDAPRAPPSRSAGHPSERPVIRRAPC